MAIIVKNLVGTVVYELGQFGQYAGEKRGKPCCWKKVITDAYNTGYGGKWAASDDTGQTFRLVLDGVKSGHTARRTAEGYVLSSSLSLTPVGEILG